VKNPNYSKINLNWIVNDRNSKVSNGVLKNLLRNAFACMGVETNEDICFLGGLFACSLY